MIALVAFVSSMILPVAGVANYSYWGDHSIVRSGSGIYSIVASAPPNGIEDIYIDKSVSSPTIGEWENEYSVTFYDVTMGTATVGSAATFKNIWNGAKNSSKLTVSTSYISAVTGSTLTTSDDGRAFQCWMRIGSNAANIIPVGPLYVIHSYNNQPLVADFEYSPSEPWIAPQNVLFTDKSEGPKPDDYWWEITGNNYYAYSKGADAKTFNATFLNPGIYQVGLSVYNNTEVNSKVSQFTVINEAGSYSLIMAPNEGTTATNFTAAITAGVDSLGAVLNQFTISCTESGKNSYCTVDGKDPVFVKQNDGNWYLDGDLYSATFPANIPLKFNIPGIHTVKAWFFTSDPTDTGTEVSDTVTVTSSPGQIKLTVEVRDAGTNAIIGGPDILMKKEDGTWDNQTVGLGFRDYYVNGGNNIGIGATAPGYTDSAIEYTRFYADAKKVVLLSRIPDGVPEGNNTLSVYVRKGGGPDVIGLEGATVKLNDGQTKLTPGSGLAQFLVLDGKTYFITVTKTGYEKMVRNLAVSGSVNSITMDMLPVGVTTSPTLAPGETPAPGTTTLAPGTTYPPGVPMPGTTITYPPGVPVIGGDGSTVATNGTARDLAVQNLETWMIWGGTAFVAIFAVMFIGFSGDALKKWSWLWK